MQEKQEVEVKSAAAGQLKKAGKRLAIRKGFEEFARIHGNRYVETRPDTKEDGAQKALLKLSSCA